MRAHRRRLMHRIGVCHLGIRIGSITTCCRRQRRGEVLRLLYENAQLLSGLLVARFSPVNSPALKRRRTVSGLTHMRAAAARIGSNSLLMRSPMRVLMQCPSAA
jgi:hypothetical protein